MVCFCIDRVSFPFLIIHPLHICAHRLCVSAFTESHSLCWSSPAHLCSQEVCFCINLVSFPPLIIPCASMFTGSVYLHSQSHTTVADYPLRILAHSLCVLLIMLHYPHLPTPCPFIIPSSWCVASHLAGNHSTNLAHPMCLQKVSITSTILHIFTGCIPQYTSRWYAWVFTNVLPALTNLHTLAGMNKL